MCVSKTTPSLSQHSELPSPGLRALWLGHLSHSPLCWSAGDSDQGTDP